MGLTCSTLPRRARVDAGACTHRDGPTAERFVRLEATVAEIERKRAEGAELMPELKGAGAARKRE